MRLDECQQVERDLSEHLGINLTVVDAAQAFIDGLTGIEDPEQKRKFIGMSTLPDDSPDPLVPWAVSLRNKMMKETP